MYTKYLVKYRNMFFVASAVLVVALSAGIREVRFDASPEANFDPSNPQLLDYQKLEKEFTKKDNIFLALTPLQGDVYSQRFLSAVHTATQLARRIPGVLRVDSITNHIHSSSHDDELTVKELIPRNSDISALDVPEFKSVVVSERGLQNRLVDEAGIITAINMTLVSRLEDSEIVAAVLEVKRIQKVLEEEFGIATYLTGSIVNNVVLTEISQSEFSTLIPLVYVSMFVVLGYLLRYWAGVFVVLFLTVTACLASVGMAGWLNVSLNPVSISSINVLITVVIAQCVHVLTYYTKNIAQGRGKTESIERALTSNFLGLSLATVTTIIGFGCMRLSDMPPIRDLGAIVSVGLAISFVSIHTILPALVMALPGSGANRRLSFIHRDSLLVRCISEKPLQSLLIGFFSAAVVVSLIPMNIINDNFLEFVSEDIEYRTDTEYIDKYLGSTCTLEYVLDSGSTGGINDPEYIRKVAEFSDWARQQPEIFNVTSYVDILEGVHKSLSLPTDVFSEASITRELAAQYLVLYEMSLPYGRDLNNLINLDKSATLVTLSFPSADTPQMLRIQNKVQSWLEDNIPEFSQPGASISSMFAHIGLTSAISGAKSVFIALLLISLVLFIGLRSLRLGAISLLPNLLAPAMGLGLWAIIDGEVGMTLTSILAISLGIVVDDTVHFIAKFKEASRRIGQAGAQAVAVAFEEVGPALVTTTIVLAIGFAIQATSSFYPTASMALLCATVVILALILDFTILPALLILSSKRAGGDQAKSSLT